MHIIDNVIENADKTFNTAEGVTVVPTSKDFVVRFTKRSHAELRRQRYDTILSNPPLYTSKDMVLYEYIGPDVVELYEMCNTDDEMIALATRLTLDIYAAVCMLHDSLVVHLDIKPDNICVSSTGKCRLIDGGGATTINAEGVSTDPCFYTLAACKRCVWTTHTIKDLRQHDYYALAETIVSVVPVRKRGNNKKTDLLIEMSDALRSMSRDKCDRVVAQLQTM